MSTKPADSASQPNAAAEAALDFVRDGMRIGLGTGRAATAFVEALGRRVAAGLRVTGVPTSEATAALARRLAIPLARIDEVPRLDITFDGADEVDPQLDLIKGYGAAMVREKIVALSSDQLVILVGPEKLVEKLGERGRLPIEVLPFGVALVRAELDRLGLACELRAGTGAGPGTDKSPLVTDNGNWILDAQLRPPLDARALEQAICALPGVLGTGFFLGLADAVIVGDGDTVDLRRRSG
jgi:ribose 5-phosphate isomerase A